MKSHNTVYKMFLYTAINIQKCELKILYKIKLDSKYHLYIIVNLLLLYGWINK